MSLWVQISQVDIPRPRICLFKCAVTIQRIRPVIVPPDGSKGMSSCSNYCTAFSATGFLFLFLMRPISKKMRWNCRSSSVVSEMRPLPPSICTTSGGSYSGTNSFVRHMMASRSVGSCSLVPSMFWCKRIHFPGGPGCTDQSAERHPKILRLQEQVGDHWLCGWGPQLVRCVRPHIGDIGQ